MNVRSHITPSTVVHNQNELSGGAADAELVSLASSVLTGHAEVTRLSEHTIYQHPDIENIVANGRDAMARMSKIASTTNIGQRAKADVFLAIQDDDLAISLARDVMTS
jgi:hypothetical protein